ncbi:GtrA family protein [Streptomyces resistomycificus]|uniref:GtrA family protein n=1 Tax=Streptomyces resistomycificus TaxID=67356 RepID=UPI000996807D|nr:GtrA family protein [Streptomyces resistomycificus]
MESLLPSKPKSAPGPVSSFVRFVVCGGGIGVLSSLAVPLVAVAMPWAVANAVITVASTLLCTELHALFTFGTGRRPGWRRHLQSAGSATAAYVVTCAAMFLLHAVQSSPSMLREQAVYLTASGLAGIGRFLVLRLFVFAGGARERTVPVTVAVAAATTATATATANATAARTEIRQRRTTVDEWSLPLVRAEAFAG